MDTPLTDRWEFVAQAVDGTMRTSEVKVVMGSRARRLERDRAELKEALKAILGHGYCENKHPASQDYVAKSAITKARAALSKLEE